ncbi:MAG: hypothetical protein EBU36_08220 [Verrucomicrobia bacterium]|nr:hypothetical protein [Verrucomicrobiota bacterium]
MIPKIIHYVWLGGKPLSPLGEKCLASWKNFLPGWEIRRWDESNSPMDHPYVQAMMKSGRMAFASDLIRLHALLMHGGLYLDTDVELRKSPGELVGCNRMTLGFHSVQNRLRKCALATCWITAPPDFPLLRNIRGRYEKLGRAVINNTFFTEEILPLFSGQEIPPSGDFEYLETPQVRIYHRDYFGAEPGRQSQVEPVAIHHGTGEWGGQADPLPWWRRLYDLRLDRRVLRPIEQILKVMKS